MAFVVRTLGFVAAAPVALIEAAGRSRNREYARPRAVITPDGITAGHSPNPHLASLRATARLVDTDKLPTTQITVRIDLRGQPQQHWMLLHRPQVVACIRCPGTL